MSSESPLQSDTEPRSVSNLEHDNHQKLAIYEQKLQDLETRRLEGLDHAIILQEKVSGLEAKLLVLEKEKELALAESKSKSAAYDEISTKLRDLESLNPGAVLAAPPQEDKLAELEAKNKNLELKIQKNNSQKQAFADQFNKLEEQLTQAQVQSKVFQEKITYLESSGRVG
jgi:hypothetical protein